MVLSILLEIHTAFHQHKLSSQLKEPEASLPRGRPRSKWCDNAWNPPLEQHQQNLQCHTWKEVLPQGNRARECQHSIRLSWLQSNRSCSSFSGHPFSLITTLSLSQPPILAFAFWSNSNSLERAGPPFAYQNTSGANHIHCAVSADVSLSDHKLPQWP